TNSLGNDRFGSIHFSSCEATGNFGGGLRVHVQDDSAFDLAFESDHRGDTFPAVAVFLHRTVRDSGRSLHHYGKHRIERADERLNQVHFHRELSPAAPTGVATLSSLST